MYRGLAIIAPLILCLGIATRPAFAIVEGEPGTCTPPCRSGFMCKEGQCVSLCNPPCGPGERCVKGECELLQRKDAPRPRDSYLGLFGVFQAPLNDSATSSGEVRVEFGGKYSTLQIGPAFGENLTMLKAAILGHVPFQLTKQVPLYLVPTIAIGYAYGWEKTPQRGSDGHLQDIFLSPGLRLRYDLHARLAIMADLIQVQVTFLRLRAVSGEVTRQDVVPVTWNLALGFAFLL